MISVTPLVTPGGFACEFPSGSGAKPTCFIVISTDYDRFLSIDKNVSEYVDERTH